MNKKLYNLMDWAKIEEVVYGECDKPSEFLGSHNYGRQSLVQCFFPGAESVTVYIEDLKAVKGRTVKEEVKMEQADEAGFFAVLLPGNDRTDYKYHVVYPADAQGDDNTSEKRAEDVRDIYNYGRLFSEEDEDRFISGGEKKAYEYMGAHKKTVKGVRGTVFRVWAPDAVRVSVCGDFNSWKGLGMPMNRLERSGIFELFIPGIEAGEKYKYEIVMRGGSKTFKADPYSFRQELRPDSASIVCNISSHKWEDSKWLEARKKDKRSINIYEVPLSSCSSDEGFIRINELAPSLAKYVKGMGYTHVSLMPVNEYPDDDSNGFHPSLLFAPTSRFGTPEDYMRFVDIMHSEGIGVILQWASSDFSNADYGLGGFDGTALYENPDPRRGMDPRTGMFLFDAGRYEVKEYLLSALDFFAGFYHIDGFAFTEVTGTLYLDYYRKPGEWETNIYGGVENLEYVNFYKEANKMLHNNYPGIITIAEESSGYSTVTGDGDDSLGFDYKSDSNFINEITHYLSKDPIERRNYHQELTDSTLYQYCENYILPVSRMHLDFRQGGLYSRMNGDDDMKWENLKLLFAYQAFHVGKMSTFMGQEAGNPVSFEGVERIDISAHTEKQQYFINYIKELNRFYAAHPALSEDSTEEGFTWISENAADDNVLSFVRKSGKDVLLIAFNFANVEYNCYELGVPADGNYQEIFCSAGVGFGGAEDANESLILVKDEKVCGFEQSVSVRLKPLSVSVFAYLPYTKEEQAIIEKRKAERIRIRKELLEKKKKITDARVKIREDLKVRLQAQIAEAEEKIASGSEYKKGKVNK
ncbi:MAG: 1,4-alpha-glucan branching enzyme GlgB [Firmicutes bacterium ADurb.Bin354]|nr:MAG: 1,4-alpha-glucan branching enzyme GlgB [Firmicutes bacterium ADurb.Bin354]